MGLGTAQKGKEGTCEKLMSYQECYMEKMDTAYNPKTDRINYYLKKLSALKDKI